MIQLQTKLTLKSEEEEMNTQLAVLHTNINQWVYFNNCLQKYKVRKKLDEPL